jgi:hypothetical protein
MYDIIHETMRERVIRTSYSLPPELAKFARARAGEKNTSVSAVVAEALTGYKNFLRREQTHRTIAMNEGRDREIIDLTCCR